MRYDTTTLAASGLRFLLGWFMFFAGIEKVVNPGWSASGFLLSAKTFPAFYSWFASSANAWWVDPLNAWGITLIGTALLLGVAVRPAAWAGVALMILYYFPQVAYPFVLPHGFIVEEHVIYAAVFILVAIFPPAQVIGFSRMLRGSFAGELPILRNIL